MSDSDLLLSIAEIAIALAGFSGLATVLGHASNRTDPALVAGFVQSVLVTALLAAAFSLLPFLPNRFGASDALTWRLSAGAFALCWTIYGSMTFRQFRSLAQSGTYRRTALSYFRITLFSAAILGLLFVSLGFFPGSARGIYLFGLFVLLFLSGDIFVQVFRSLILPPR